MNSRLQIWCIALAVFLADGQAVDAQTIMRTLPANDFAAALQRAVGGTTVHLHNFGPLSGGTYYAANASSIKVPASLSGVPGQRTYFSLPEATTTVLGRRYGYYVDHVRSNGVFVTAAADSFTISVTLASSGPALVGTCVRLKTPAVACASLGDKLLPGIEWRDARIDLVAKPIVVDRSLAFDVLSVAIIGTFDVGKTCEWPLLGKRLCAAVGKQSQRIRQRVADEVKASLNTSAVRRAVALGVREHLDSTLNAPLFGIRQVAMQNGEVTVALAFGR